VARRLVSRGIFASSGDFYATTVCEGYGIRGLLRVGCSCYTTESEVERLLDAVRAM
jgi:selenocysteine lyase/cysteine desulfurase